MARPVVAQERYALAQLLGVPQRQLRHCVAVRSVDIAHGASQSVQISIPNDATLLITNFEFSSYALDTSGLYLRMPPGTLIDNTTMQFSLNGTPQNVPGDHRLYNGNVFLPFGIGQLSITFAYSNLNGAGSPAQRVQATVHGYFVLTGDMEDGTSADNMGQLLAELAQQSTQPSNITEG